ncbi:MAG TPA: bifunctional 4-hydroxy-2-oxoglutarate aldolase/2-dehydro-3-deoxy-phosphogluconate aldolase [Phycisphaerales bacterium]|nr:bifunctional 4-hydroxy-2-oxoglutarate aldolase/2-dehydro-3-deoxy-phosphogluconate aldolase [Phycisphaerales bacterium]
MARHSRLETLSRMKRIGLVPVYYQSDPDVAIQIARACVAAGAMVLEFTNRGDRAVDVFGRLAEFRDAQQPDLALGVGSVVDAPTAALYIAAGADFVVGPVMDEDTAFLCNTRKIPYCPGCGSASEVHRAHRLGVEICKVFPGGCVGGPAFVKSIKGPMPWTDIMPTGGVSPTEENLTEWLAAGAACIGMGSKLITKDLVQQKNFDQLTSDVRQTLERIQRIRATLKT